MDTENPRQVYLESQRRDARLEPLWSALLASLKENLEDRDLSRLWALAGREMARRLPLPSCETLSDIEAAVNTHWAAMGWGYVELTEEPECVRIVHEYPPRAAALNEASDGSVIVFFEAAYQQWFQLLGAGEALRVQAQEAQEEGEALRFRFARVD